MQVELEAKFLNIDKEKLRSTLANIGGVLVHTERLMKRKTFDFPDFRFKKVGGWVRVRDEGDQVTLAYKQLLNRKLDGTKEISVIVNDFNKTCELLENIGFCMKSYQETKRERWLVDEVEVTLDTWPWIPPLVELEGSSEQGLKQIAAKLHFDWAQALHGSVENAYQAVYNVSEEEIDEIESITFAQTPEWLEKRRKFK